MSNPSEVMKLARETAAFFAKWLDGGNSVGFLSAHSVGGLSDSMAHAIMADRASCQARIEELERALKPFAAKYDDLIPDKFDVADGLAQHPERMRDDQLALVTFPLGAFRAARSTLEGK